jgi:hypothetical protein
MQTACPEQQLLLWLHLLKDREMEVSLDDTDSSVARCCLPIHLFVVCPDCFPASENFVSAHCRSYALLKGRTLKLINNLFYTHTCEIAGPKTIIINQADAGGEDFVQQTFDTQQELDHYLSLVHCGGLRNGNRVVAELKQVRFTRHTKFVVVALF